MCRIVTGFERRAGRCTQFYFKFKLLRPISSVSRNDLCQFKITFFFCICESNQSIFTVCYTLIDRSISRNRRLVLFSYGIGYHKSTFFRNYISFIIDFFNFIVYVSRHAVSGKLLIILECEYTDSLIKIHVPVFLSYRSIDLRVSCFILYNFPIFICLKQSHTETIIPAVIRLICTGNRLPDNKSL